MCLTSCLYLISGLNRGFWFANPITITWTLHAPSRGWGCQSPLIMDIILAAWVYPERTRSEGVRRTCKEFCCAKALGAWATRGSKGMNVRDASAAPIHTRSMGCVNILFDASDEIPECGVLPFYSFNPTVNPKP